VSGRFGEQDLGFHGEIEQPRTLEAFAQALGERLARDPLVIGDASREVRRVAWCTGAAQGYLEEAVRLGVDVFVSGEISEQTVHLARESGVAFISAGHHATERYGIAALGAHLATRFGVVHHFIDVPNPV
jgi:putative NIF3 family GTP cyclohydrolase 1 type 2